VWQIIFFRLPLLALPCRTDYTAHMDPDRTLTRLFVVLGCILAALAALASLWLRSWVPLVAVGVVMLCVMALTLSEAAIFAPLLMLVMRAGARTGKTKPKSTTDPAAPETVDPAPPKVVGGRH